MIKSADSTFVNNMLTGILPVCICLLVVVFSTCRILDKKEIDIFFHSLLEQDIESIHEKNSDNYL